MPVAPRNESEDPLPREERHAGDVVRRYEITVERECLAIRNTTVQDSRGHSPGAAQRFSQEDSGQARQNLFPGTRVISSILNGFFHLRRGRFSRRLRSGSGGNDDVSS